MPAVAEPGPRPCHAVPSPRPCAPREGYPGTCRAASLECDRRAGVCIHYKPIKNWLAQPWAGPAPCAAAPQPLAASGGGKNHSSPCPTALLSVAGANQGSPAPHPAAHGRGEDVSLRVHHAGLLPGDDGHVHHERGEAPDLHHLLRRGRAARRCGHHLEHVPVLPAGRARGMGMLWGAAICHGGGEKLRGLRVLWGSFSAAPALAVGGIGVW